MQLKAIGFLLLLGLIMPLGACDLGGGEETEETREEADEEDSQDEEDN